MILHSVHLQSIFQNIQYVTSEQSMWELFVSSLEGGLKKKDVKLALDKYR